MRTPIGPHRVPPARGDENVNPRPSTEVLGYCRRLPPGGRTRISLKMFKLKSGIGGTRYAKNVQTTVNPSAPRMQLKSALQFIGSFRVTLLLTNRCSGRNLEPATQSWFDGGRPGSVLPRS